METAAFVLIILLSSVLIIFLIALTILVINLNRISKTVQQVVDQAESVAENVASASKYFKPAVMSGVAAKFVSKVLNNEKPKKKRSHNE